MLGLHFTLILTTIVSIGFLHADVAANSLVGVVDEACSKVATTELEIAGVLSSNNNSRISFCLDGPFQRCGEFRVICSFLVD